MDETFEKPNFRLQKVFAWTLDETGRLKEVAFNRDFPVISANQSEAQIFFHIFFCTNQNRVFRMSRFSSLPLVRSAGTDVLSQNDPYWSFNFPTVVKVQSCKIAYPSVSLKMEISGKSHNCKTNICGNIYRNLEIFVKKSWFWVSGTSQKITCR